MPEHFRDELFTVGRYTNPASFTFFCKVIDFQMVFFYLQVCLHARLYVYMSVSAVRWFSAEFPT